MIMITIRSSIITSNILTLTPVLLVDFAPEKERNNQQ